MSGGLLIAVVGPSGAGKDSVIDGLLAASPGLCRIRRVITRPPGAGGEDHDAVSPEDFAAAVAEGAFCLHWQAHGLRYGIPVQAVTEVRNGAFCLANLSRAALVRAMEVFPRMMVLNVTASPQVLARRLARRGRESGEEIVERLRQTGPELPQTLDIVTLVNDGPLDETVAKALDALRRAGFEA